MLLLFSRVQLGNPMNCSTVDFPVLHCVPGVCSLSSPLSHQCRPTISSSQTIIIFILFLSIMYAIFRKASISILVVIFVLLPLFNAFSPFFFFLIYNLYYPFSVTSLKFHLLPKPQLMGVFYFPPSICILFQFLVLLFLLH